MNNLRISLLALVGLTACGTTANYERTAGLAAEFSALGNSLAALKQQVDTSLQGLSSLTANGGSDAVGAYEMIRTAAAGIGPGVEQIKEALASAEAYGKDHFDSWARQNTAIQNAELRTRASERQNELATLMNTTSSSITRSLAMGQGYQQSLQDLEKYLSSDLSPTAIGNAADLIARIRGDGSRFSASIDSAQKDAAHMANKLDG
jgi:hypothetical protein